MKQKCSCGMETQPGPMSLHLRANGDHRVVEEDEATPADGVSARWVKDYVAGRGGWAEDYQLRQAAKVAGIDFDAALEQLGPDDLYPDNFGGGTGVCWRTGPRPEWRNDWYDVEPVEATVQLARMDRAREQKATELRRASEFAEQVAFLKSVRAAGDKLDRERAALVAASARADNYGDPRPRSWNAAPDRIREYNVMVAAGTSPVVAAAAAGLATEPKRVVWTKRGPTLDGEPVELGKTYAYRRDDTGTYLARPRSA